MPETTLSAEIEREALCEILNTAIEGLREKHKEALLVMEESVLKFAASRKRGLFKWRRNWTRDEADQYLATNCWHWTERRDVARAAEDIRRADKLLSMAEKSSLSGIRLTESDLLLLKDYMN